jgi:outer membrane protein assembly factor BamE (lipoprotein component of BamABCDE complex)
MTPRSSLFALVFAMALALASASSGLAQPDAASEVERAGAGSDPACALAPDAWKDRERWRRLEKGMSRFDVLRLLGDPGKVSSYDGFERWEYPGALGARVNFDDRGRVVGWIAP